MEILMRVLEILDLPAAVAGLGLVLLLGSATAWPAGERLFQAAFWGGLAALAAYLLPAWYFQHDSDAMFCSFVLVTLSATPLGLAAYFGVGGAWLGWGERAVPVVGRCLQFGVLLAACLQTRAAYTRWTVHPGDQARAQAAEADARATLRAARFTVRSRPEGLALQLGGRDHGKTPAHDLAWDGLLGGGPTWDQRIRFELRSPDGELRRQGHLWPGRFPQADDSGIEVRLRAGPVESGKDPLRDGLAAIVAASHTAFRALRPRGTEELPEWVGPVPAWIPDAAGAQLRVLSSYVRYEVAVFDGLAQEEPPPGAGPAWIAEARTRAEGIVDALEEVRGDDAAVAVVTSNDRGPANGGWSYFTATSGDGSIEVSAAAWREDQLFHRNLSVVFWDSKADRTGWLEP